MYEDAVRVVLEMGKASTSTLQRRLRLGYGRAARILDMMQRDGIIGPPDGSRPREVLKRPDWLVEVGRYGRTARAFRSIHHGLKQTRRRVCQAGTSPPSVNLPVVTRSKSLGYIYTPASRLVIYLLLNCRYPEKPSIIETLVCSHQSGSSES